MKIIILVVFVSFGGIFLLGAVVAAICCYLKKMKKEKKKTEHEMEIIHVDDHRRVKEAIVPGPHGPRAVVLEIDDDLHIDGVVRKDEVVENVRGGKHEDGHHGGCDITTQAFGKHGDDKEITMASWDSVSTAEQGEELELDRISKLPDELVINIVSRLTLVDAVRTSVLSSRWIHLWKSAVSVLDFDASEELLAISRLPATKAIEELWVTRCRYMNRVNRVLSQMQQSCSKLTKFRVAFNLDDECNSKGDVDRWLKFAISKRVESLHLALDAHMIHSLVFSEECYIHIRTPTGMRDVGFLRSLRLSYVQVGGEVLEHFIANCPVLEELAVDHSGLLTRLKVVGSSHSPLPLKHLEVTSCLYLASVEIDHTPHLQRLILDGWGCAVGFRVGYCPSLVDIAVGNDFIFGQTFRALSEFASRLVSLFLKSYWCQPISGASEHRNLERLTVQGVASSSCSILGLIPLINVCPRLHTLQLFLHTHHYNIRDRPLLDVVKVRRDSIKVVEVVGFRGYIMEYEFLEYVMEYFVGLERIVIDWSTASVFHGRTVRRCSEEEAREAEKRALELKSRAPATVEFLVI
ncbi:Protein TRACHEARY ELEMENT DIFFERENTIATION-RELATED 6 [Linum grandiflorum]